MDISIPEHTIFFSGYMDAVSRLYSDHKVLCGMSAEILLEGSSISDRFKCTVIETKEIKNMTTEFQHSVAELLQADTEQRVLFYLIDYFSWYKDLTISCHCTSYKLIGASIPEKYFAYMLNVNNEYNVLIYISLTNK